MSKSLLLIHPDDAVRRDIRTRFAAEDFDLFEANEFGLGDSLDPDIVLVDWTSLNPISQSLQWIRGKCDSPELQIFVLATESDYNDAVRSLELGADDCIAFPLRGDELLIRVRVALSRPHNGEVFDQLTAGPIVLDRKIHRVQVKEHNLELAPTEFRLLAFLLENQGRVFSRNELLSRAWSSNVKAGDRTVDVHVRRLRQQLEPFHCSQMIQTVRGFGYRLRAE